MTENDAAAPFKLFDWIHIEESSMVPTTDKIYGNRLECKPDKTLYQKSTLGLDIFHWVGIKNSFQVQFKVCCDFLVYLNISQYLG